ncbi:Metacaspase-1 [Vanrija pseudolonga]|uniref:Metacaspase-1 n=1 Tax=Vanrija pseudolonga TaxID=143232 RepID=A0AAF0Y1K4_9TREE|nr:Metacaspase-1 [Vanrija pseudolonga]
MTAIFDSCHSGTVMDLPYAYSTKGTVKEPNYAAEGGMGLLKAGMDYASGNSAMALVDAFSTAKHMFHLHQGNKVLRDTRTAPADVVAWGGCKDTQTSADASQNGAATGAMSWAFVRALRENPNLTYQQLLVALRNLMVEGGYSQKPQLSACHPIDVNTAFFA